MNLILFFYNLTYTYFDYITKNMIKESNESNQINRITSALSNSSSNSENEFEHNLNDPKPFLYPPDARDIFRLPNAGLYHSEKILNNVRNTLYKNNISYIAMYSDYVTRGSVNENRMIEQAKILLSISVEKFSQETTTKIGNIAYLSLYCVDKHTRQTAGVVLIRWKEYETRHQKNHGIGRLEYTIIKLIIIIAVIGIIYYID